MLKKGYCPPGGKGLGEVSHREADVGGGGQVFAGSGVGRDDVLDACEDAVLDGGVEFGVLGVVGEAVLHLLTSEMVLGENVVVGTQHLGGQGVVAILGLDSIEALEEVGVGEKVDHLRGVNDIGRALAVAARGKESDDGQKEDKAFHG